jgi:hypothetical protein
MSRVMAWGLISRATLRAVAPWATTMALKLFSCARSKRKRANAGSF